MKNSWFSEGIVQILIQGLKGYNIWQKNKKDWVKEQEVLTKEQDQKHVFIGEKQL